MGHGADCEGKVPEKQPQSYMALGATQGHENICLISRRPYGA